MAALPRESKYRHIFNDIGNNDQCYVDIKPDCFGESQHIAVNTKYWAVPIQAGGGGSFMVHALDKPGRIPLNHPLFKIHTSRILELAFGNFAQNIIASSSDDCTVRVCKIPDEITENVRKEDVCLNGHSKKVTSLAWHPTSDHLLASSGVDKNVIIWDVEAGEEAINLSDHEDLVYSIRWNANGQYLASSCQDRIIRIIDPRGEESSVLCTEGHQSKKISKIFWMDNRQMVGSIGFNKDSFRELAFFDIRKIDKAFHRMRLDRQNSKFFPYFEEGNDILFLAGKGDTGVRAYEISDQEGFCHPVTEMKTMAPQKGVAILPRRSLDTGKCEIFKMMRLKSSAVEPVSVMVPRRNSENVFQEDLYPDCYAGKPSITIDQYFDNVTKDCILMSMNTKAEGKKTGGRFKRRQKASASKPQPTQKTDKKPAEKAKPSADLSKESEKKENKIQSLEKKLSALQKKNEALAQEEEAAKESKAKLKKSEADNAKLQKNVDSLSGRVRELEGMLEEVGNQEGGRGDEDSKELSKAQRRLKNAKKKVRRLEKEVEEAEDIINKQADNIKGLYKKISQLEN